MSINWDREQVEKLIMCVEENACIYNIKSTEYLDRNKKAQAYNSILEEMQKMESCMTLAEIKRKWKNLRTQYMQELRAVNQSEKSGAGRTDVHVPKLWFFQQLHFLRTHSEMRNSKDNTEVEEISTSSTQEEAALSEEPHKKRQKALGAVNSLRKDLGNFKTMLAERNNVKEYICWETLLPAPENQPHAAWQVQCLMRKLTTPEKSRASSFSKDILELSMEGIFDDDDLN